MTKDDGKTVVRDKTFNQTFTVVNSVSTTPSVGLFQPCFPLSEADFIKMSKTSNTLTALGGGIFSYSVSYALPKVIDAYKNNLAKSVDLATTDIYIISVTLVIGVALFIASYYFSSDKRNVIKKIKNHFIENPGKQVIG
jgi:amino acid permease